MRVKIFGATGRGWSHNRLTDSTLESVEAQVNQWLETNPDHKVVRVEQSAAGGGWGHMQLVLSVWYEPVT